MKRFFVNRLVKSLQHLETRIDEIQEHYYQNCIQDATYRAQTEELEEGEVVIHVDYSENFKNKTTK